MAALNRRVSNAAIDVEPSIRAAMKLLHQAYAYGKDVELPIWDFAVEIQRLRDAGVTNSDLRWLLLKGYVEHACETTFRGDENRSFRPQGPIIVNEQTGFIITERGRAFTGSRGLSIRMAELFAGSNAVPDQLFQFL